MAKAKAKKPKKQAETAPVVVQTSTSNDKGRGKSNERRAKLGADLAMEIDALRTALTELLEGYRLRIDGELLQLASAARGETPFDAKPHKLPVAVTQKMLTSIRKTEIKPKKARAKDLQRIQDLVKDLVELLPAAK